MGLPVRLAGLLLALVLLAPGAQAWHWPDEAVVERFGSRAGDARIPVEAGECMHRDDGETERRCLVLYAHALALEQAVPLNAQRPADCAPDPGHGTVTPGIEPFWSASRIELRPVAGMIEYDPANCHERPLVHPPSLPRPPRPAPGTDIMGHWYLSADARNTTPLGSAAAPLLEGGVMPCLTVRMALVTGARGGDGDVLAVGETTKHVLSLPEGGERLPGLPQTCPGATGFAEPGAVTHFPVNLGRLQRHATGAGYHLKVQWYQWDGGDPDAPDNLVQHDWRLHAGPDHPNRLVLPVGATLRIAAMELEERDGRLHIMTQVASRLGPYDIDTGNIRLVLLAGNGTRHPLSLEPHVRLPDSDGIGGAVRTTHTWDYQAAELAPGEYALHYLVANWQHTETAYRTVPLWIASDGTWTAAPAGEPSAALAWQPSELTLLLVLALAATGLVYLAAAGRRHGDA